jgi:hypothetical protein
MSYDQLRNIPRGEGEGSESVVSAYTPRQDNYNVTFEQLLSSSFDSISKDIDDSHDKTIRESLQNELVRCQQQIAHLTSLLRYANVFSLTRVMSWNDIFLSFLSIGSQNPIVIGSLS